MNEPNTWPSETTAPGFREFTTRFYWDCWQTAQQILRALAVGLGMDDEDYLLNFHDGHSNQVSLRHYMPIAAAEIETNQKERLAAHTDFGSVTMLFQDDCGGLEVECPGQPGKYISATPIENALVMNIGDVLMRWSNGKSFRKLQNLL
jgi:isopenicillin N synthase-like dioxygenase